MQGKTLLKTFLNLCEISQHHRSFIGDSRAASVILPQQIQAGSCYTPDQRFALKQGEMLGAGQCTETLNGLDQDIINSLVLEINYW